MQARQESGKQSHQKNDRDHHRNNREVRPEIQSNRNYAESGEKWLEVNQASEAISCEYKTDHSPDD